MVISCTVMPRTFSPRAGEAVGLAHDDLLRHVHQTAGQVARVGGTKRGIGQRLAAAVGAQEELQHLRPSRKLARMGQFKRLAAGGGHQAAHAGQLADLRRAAAGAGIGHHADGVELVQTRQDAAAQVGGGGVPDIDDLGVALVLGEHTHAVQAVDLGHLIVGLLEDLALFGRHDDVADRHRDRAAGGVLEAEVLDVVQHLGGFVDAVLEVHLVHDLASSFLPTRLSISSANISSRQVRGFLPMSCGITSLNSSRPSVQSMILRPFTPLNSRSSRTLMGACRLSWPSW